MKGVIYMSKSKKKQRTIYAFKTVLFLSNDDKSSTEFGWDAEKIKNLMGMLIKLPELNRRSVDPNSEWSMQLEKCEIDPLKPNIIFGYFHSTKQGLRTKVQHIETGDTKDNPKLPGYNEIRTTCFTLRLTDGLFLLADYGDNVASTARIARYLTQFGKELCPEINLSGIQFDNLISKDFLDKLNSFQRINTLEILIDSKSELKTDDAIGTLQEELSDVKQGKIQIILQRGDNPTLSSKGVYDWVKNKMKKHIILQGKIKGKPSPGNPKELRLTGMEEKYQNKFPTDRDEEVLTEPLFEFIIKLAEERGVIS